MFYFTDYNFTHRIDQFSFGPQVGGIVNPLDGDIKITEKREKACCSLVKF